ncbi:hypothetical protein QBC44DRAFT_332004 [Cladorrhinum sp. PSN332]|nr:hypothetical protein QBC44DRAFT_332004 [Cladorrhinum sp. PSN332]
MANRIEIIPPELRLMILAQLDMNGLVSLIGVSPVYWQQYRYNRGEVFRQCFDNSPVLRDQLPTVIEMLNYMELTNPEEARQYIATSHFRLVRPITKLFCKWANANFARISSQLGIETRQLIGDFYSLTVDERDRIERVLHRYRRGDFTVWDPIWPRRDYWEHEQRECVLLFLTNTTWNILHTLGSVHSWSDKKVTEKYPQLEGERGFLRKWFNERDAPAVVFQKTWFRERFLEGLDRFIKLVSTSTPGTCHSTTAPAFRPDIVNFRNNPYYSHRLELWSIPKPLVCSVDALLPGLIRSPFARVPFTYRPPVTNADGDGEPLPTGPDELPLPVGISAKPPATRPTTSCNDKGSIRVARALSRVTSLPAGAPCAWGFLVYQRRRWTDHAGNAHPQTAYVIPNELRHWGYVFWDAERIMGDDTGGNATAVLRELVSRGATEWYEARARYEEQNKLDTAGITDH